MARGGGNQPGAVKKDNGADYQRPRVTQSQVIRVTGLNISSHLHLHLTQTFQQSTLPHSRDNPSCERPSLKQSTSIKKLWIMNVMRNIKSQHWHIAEKIWVIKHQVWTKVQYFIESIWKNIIKLIFYTRMHIWLLVIEYETSQILQKKLQTKNFLLSIQ